jgi:hypothetical protein
VCRVKETYKHPKSWDLSALKVINDGQLGVNGHDLTQLVTQGVINPDFVFTKPEGMTRFSLH